MGFRVVEYLCAAGHRTEELVEAPGAETKACPHYGEKVGENAGSVLWFFCGEPAERVISAPGLQLANPKNSDFNARNNAKLDARNNAHWAKKGADEAVDRIRAQRNKEG